MCKRIIITGAPGTGKTSLIDILQKKGHACFSEISRQIIIKQQQQQSNKTPWGDLFGFTNLVYHQTVEELHIPIQKNTFVDRGLPDIIAYLKTKFEVIPDYLLNFPFKEYYNNTVFLAPFWEEIYVGDPQRLQSSKDAIEIHNNLLQVYTALDFKIEILPKTTLTKRIEFIQSIII